MPAGISAAYKINLTFRLARLKRDLGSEPITSLVTGPLEGWLGACGSNHTTKNNVRRMLATLFKRHRDRGYLPQDRKTAAERTCTFAGVKLAPCIFTPDEMRHFRSIAPKKLVPYLAISVKCG